MNSGRMLVTLDGPAGVGKTTLAKRVAGALRIPYLDTGAMFRASALALGEKAKELPGEEIARGLDDLDFLLSGIGADTVLHLNGRPLGEEIRSEKVSMLASDIATLPAVREALKRAQRELGRETSLVAEGRDMGTVVFPAAEHKFFLDAAPEVRAERRRLQLEEMGRDADYVEILAGVKKRDLQDRGRETAPLKPAEDARIIDTGPLDVDGVFREIMAGIEER